MPPALLFIIDMPPRHYAAIIIDYAVTPPRRRCRHYDYAIRRHADDDARRAPRAAHYAPPIRIRRMRHWCRAIRAYAYAMPHHARVITRAAHWCAPRYVNIYDAVYDAIDAAARATRLPIFLCARRCCRHTTRGAQHAHAVWCQRHMRYWLSRYAPAAPAAPAIAITRQRLIFIWWYRRSRHHLRHYWCRAACRRLLSRSMLTLYLSRHLSRLFLFLFIDLLL